MNQSIEEHYEILSEIFGILANPIRLKILETLLTSGSCTINSTYEGCCVCEINEAIDLPQPYISKHLKILRDKGILSYEREGNKIYYKFAPNDKLKRILEYLSKFCNCC